MLDQAALQLALGNLRAEGEEVEIVGVLDELLGEIGLGGGERRLEVSGRLTLTAIEAALSVV